MRRKYLRVTAIPDENGKEKLVALKKEVSPEVATAGEDGLSSVTLGSYRRFRRRTLQKKIETAAQDMHCFTLTLKEWKTVSESEICLYPDKSEETERFINLLCGKCTDREPQIPYISFISGTPDQIKEVSKKLENVFTPLTVGICALELDKSCPPELILRKELLPAPELRAAPEEKAIDLSGMLLKDLQPSQFYISEAKLRKTEQWFNPEDLSNFEPISVKEMDGKIVMLDGHTRAVAALNAGLDMVPLVWETEEWDWDMYRRCVHECEQRDVLSPLDLIPRVISAEEYWEKWDAWCDRMQAEVEAARKA